RDPGLEARHADGDQGPHPERRRRGSGPRSLRHDQPGAVMGALVAVLLCCAAQESPQKLKFQVEHLNLETKKAAPLKADEAKSFAAELKEMTAVQDAGCTETTATVTLKPDAKLRWTELKAAGKKTLSY